MEAILDLPEMRERVRRWSVAEYRKLTEDEPAFQRSALIRGLIIETMPKSPLHEYLTGLIADFLRSCVLVGWFVRQEASLQLADSVPEPDVAVVRGAPGDFRAEHPTSAELIVEVAVSSVALDRANASLYAEAGVAEYWIVLAATEQVEVCREPMGGEYRKRRIYARGEVIEGVSVLANGAAVDRLFA